MTTRDSSGLFERIRFKGRPIAHPDSVVVSGDARFTVLTPRLVRLEWSETGRFEDRGTYAFPTRYTQRPPHVSVRTAGDDLLIDTGALLVRYARDSGPFSAENLSIAFGLEGERREWVPGSCDERNLRGTRRTLDGCEGDAALDKGLLSRTGYALFDDSQSVVFDLDDGWVAPRPDHALQDWYFFAYGHDYKACLAGYTRFGGQVPLIPRFVLGAWWSRYWAYSDQDLKELVGEFEEHDVPLDVLVIDMDWHTPDAWTGYTWNRELFPDPPAFLRWVHDKGLRTTLNLHPAQGIQPFEEVYPRFARAMGVDPEAGEGIPFHITDKRFVKPYFELIHHAMEEEGVDFWWMDWQQGESSEMKGVDPMPWINHLHFSDSRRRGKRSMLYSRWGGLGNHRYPIGFSGDTYVGWPALQFQPYFTATASNVVYGWWSHDIGGHMGGATEPELYARWVQFGALSPCLRMHSTKDPRGERRPWAYPKEVFKAARAAFHLRYTLVPYLYTMARTASDTSVSLCRPMYYEHPGEQAAYVARYQYYLGDQVIAAPIVHPADAKTGLASTDVWVPEGTWIDYATKERLNGPRWIRVVGDLERVPMLVRAGAILPLAPEFKAQEPPALSSGTTDAQPRDWLVLAVFPGKEGTFRLYEDDGVSEAYREGQYEWTEIRTCMEDESTWTVEIAPVAGRCDALPRQREYDILLQGSNRPEVVMAGDDEVADWEYNPETLTTIIHVSKQDKEEPVTVTAFARERISALGEEHNRTLACSDVALLLGGECPADPQDVDAVLRTPAPGRADAVARLGGPFARVIEYATPEEASQQLGRVIVAAPAGAEDPYDLKVAFTFSQGGQKTVRTVEKKGTNQAHILDVPFAFDGQVRPARWEAEVEISWRGQVLRQAHASQPLFPAIPVWRAVVYDRAEEPLALNEVVDARGRANAALEWVTYVQTTERLRNVNQPHVVPFWREHREELRAGKRLAGYLVTTVVSPKEQEANLWFGTLGPCEIYVNGTQIEEAAVEEAEVPHPLLRQARKTEPVHLRAGENTLLIDTRPPEQGRPIWFFSATWMAPGGELMTDLAFE
jgi:hypothetical protein